MKVEKSWRGVYEKEVEAEEVDRRMKKGKPRGKDKGVQVSTPPQSQYLPQEHRPRRLGGWRRGRRRGERGEPRLRRRTRL